MAAGSNTPRRLAFLAVLYQLEQRKRVFGAMPMIGGSSGRRGSVFVGRGFRFYLSAFATLSVVAVSQHSHAAPIADVTTPESCVAGGGYVQWENPSNHKTYFGETDCKFPLGSPQNPYPTPTTGALQAQVRARLAAIEQQRLAAANAAQAAAAARAARLQQINAGYVNLYGGMANMIGAYSAIQQQNADEQEAAQEALLDQQRAQAAADQVARETADAQRRHDIANPFGLQTGSADPGDNPFARPAARQAMGAAKPVRPSGSQPAPNDGANPFDAPAPSPPAAPMKLGDPRDADRPGALPMTPDECLAAHGDAIVTPGSSFCVVGSTWRHMPAPPR